MTDGGTFYQIAAIVLVLLVLVALARIFSGAVLPVMRNWRLAHRGFSDAPAYRRQGRGIVSLGLKLAAAIAVIAAIVAIAMPAYQDQANRTEAAARDRQRVADLAQIRNALAAYHVDHDTYPVSETETLSAPAFAAVLSDLATGGYLTALPEDPLGGTYVYQTTPTGTYYCLGADMEGAPPPSTCDAATLGTPLDSDYAVGP